jgi:cyclopropane fatty-acyl-phospholipid synthase-like methyltransferase
MTQAQANAGHTTQRAPLEKFLAARRSAQILPHVKGKRVLDFGCGEGLWNLRAIRNSAASLSGVDLVFSGRRPFTTDDGIRVCGNLTDLGDASFDVITSLACFEHIWPEQLPGVLQQLSRVLTTDGRIVGTVPAPPAQPVLEFLAYRTGLIDASQIRDHKIYYNRKSLSENVARGGWVIEDYRLFQFGMNSFFVLRKA